MIPYNKKHLVFAQQLRKNMTPEERHLWYDFLKRLPIQVKRQYNLGEYIVDFYIPTQKIAIEIDGRQHKLVENHEADRIRDEYLASWGITVLRYSNQAIRTRFPDVVSSILKHINMDISEIK